MTRSSIQGVLFDLDGTLLDTAADLSLATNLVLQAHDYPTIELATLRPVAGQGSRGLLKMAMGIDEQHPQYAGLCEELFFYYEQHLLDTTDFFPGIESVLAHLTQAKIPWGIVTNKPQRFTTKIAEKLQLDQRAGCIVSGDTLARRKPHPGPILHACQLLQQQPADCIYIGDAKIDVVASQAAGVKALAALYGYIMEGDDPQSWGAEGYIKHPEEIIGWL